MTGALLRIAALSVTYETPAGDLSVVDDLDLEMDSADSLAVIGESGSGKSVLGHAIMGLLDEQAHVAGEVWFQGLPVHAMDQRQLMEIRGSSLVLIPQSPMSALNPVLRVGSQMEEAARRNGGSTTKQARVMVHEALARVGFDNPEAIHGSYAHRLSGGMCERVLIAMALLASPALVIADEPTKGLDEPAKRMILSLFARMASETALLMITHDFAAVRCCAKIAVLYGGHIVELGPTGKVLEQPRHPYTVGLLDAQPARGMKPVPGRCTGRELFGKGCRFRSRCPLAGVACESLPALSPKETDHWVRCHFA